MLFLYICQRRGSSNAHASDDIVRQISRRSFIRQTICSQKKATHCTHWRIWFWERNASEVCGGLETASQNAKVSTFREPDTMVPSHQWKVEDAGYTSEVDGVTLQTEKVSTAKGDVDAVDRMMLMKTVSQSKGQ